MEKSTTTIIPRVISSFLSPIFILLKVFSVLHVFTEKYHVPANVALVLFVSNAFLTMAATIFQYMLFEFRIASYDVKIKRLSDRDYLTGLYNRRCIQKVAEKAFEKDTAIYSEKAVAILDIDFFKQINDTYGHAAGDEVLIELSDILRSFSKEGITAGRWGGEEFVLIKDEKVAYKDFCASLEELRHTVEEHEFVYDSQTISVSVSIGAAAFDGEPTVDKLIQKADQRLYDAKGTGRNKVVC
ncbi:MAG: GGDEF domain-containing protein [Butyrivibrio sp.]|nr:GGDEF domain-containing protein [Butyrivibrio sp.]